tara:strand:+ start:810 stop:1505 length:696 start_codon:yes stop_codon:yes gene_type:complete
MRDKYLYFGLAAAGTETFNNQADQTLELTTGFVNPIPVGVDFLTNGGAKVTVVAASSGTTSADQQWGSAYGTVVAGQTIDITKGCTIHATTAVITMKTVAQDPVYGFTIDTDTTSDNDNIVVTQLKPYESADGFVYNSRYLRGIHYQTATTTELHFQGKTGDLGATHDVDTITVTHGSAKLKEFAQELTDVIADDNKVSGMVVVRDDMRDINLTTQNASEIASVAQTATAS